MIAPVVILPSNQVIMASEVQLAMQNESFPLSKMIAYAINRTHDQGRIKTFDIDWGVDLNKENPTTGLTALMAASINGNLGTMDVLINRGSDINFRSLKLSKAAMHFAAKHGQVDALALLIHRGAVINIGDHNGTTPLMYAAKVFPIINSSLSIYSYINVYV